MRFVPQKLQGEPALRVAQRGPAEVGQGLPEMGQEQYFWVDPESNRIDIRLAEGQAACCGVNLAFAVFGVVFLGDILPDPAASALGVECGLGSVPTASCPWRGPAPEAIASEEDGGAYAIQADRGNAENLRPDFRHGR